MPPTVKFLRDTEVVAVPGTPGRYRAELGDDWSAPLLPQGGIVTALGLRAAARELDRPSHRLRSVSVAFAGQVSPGEIEIDVACLRRGRSMCQVTATSRSVGSEAGHTLVAVFGAERPGFEFTDRAMPQAPPPERCRSFHDTPPGFERPKRFDSSFWHRVDGRIAIGHAWWDTGWVADSSQRGYWTRFHETPRLSDGQIDPLALVTLCDLMPGAIGERMGPGAPEWFGPSADLTVHILGEARSEWLLACSRARRAGEGYASVELELWDPDLGLVAYGTQMMFFSFPDGAPPPDRLRPE